MKRKMLNLLIKIFSSARVEKANTEICLCSPLLFTWLPTHTPETLLGEQGQETPPSRAQTLVLFSGRGVTVLLRQQTVGSVGS